MQLFIHFTQKFSDRLKVDFFVKNVETIVFNLKMIEKNDTVWMISKYMRIAYIMFISKCLHKYVWYNFVNKSYIIFIYIYYILIINQFSFFNTNTSINIML